MARRSRTKSPGAGVLRFCRVERVNGVAGTYARMDELPLEIEGDRLERLEAPVTRDRTRITTLVRLAGSGEEGLGEDVTWYAEAHDREQAAGATRPLGGVWTLESFSSALETEEPHERWAYESAALDLALRQAGRSLADAVGRKPRPVRFVVSAALGADDAQPSADPLRRWLALYPGLRFKLDPTSKWDDALVAELAALG